MKLIDITYFAYSRVHYDTFTDETPFGEIHEKLYNRCKTYHITSVNYRDLSSPLLTHEQVQSVFTRLKKLFASKK